MKKKAGASGKIFVISAPSGCGKTTLCHRLLNDGLGLMRSISATTRLPRENEKDGVDYFFVSEEKFGGMVKNKEFLEHEDNFGYLYGTPGKAVEGLISRGKSLVLSIDVKGAMRVKKAYPGNSVLIFILPPSMKALKKRLLGRKSDREDAITKRLSVAKKELLYKDKYDYTIVNDRLDTAFNKLRKIVVSELEKKHNVTRRSGGSQCRRRQ